jgi:hypothetical protein
MFAGNVGATARALMKRAVCSTPLPRLVFLEKICWGLRFRVWLERTGSRRLPYFQERAELYSHLDKNVLEGHAIDYLEFGVAEGESIRQWMRLNSQPESRFFGFDTFEGLPEAWRHFGETTPKGAFGTHGKPPDVENELRVTWIVGLFQDTLPLFLRHFQPRNRMVVHLDADLYSSTLYVLSVLNGLLRSGAVLLFDEFASFDNEFRALEDFASAYRIDYDVLACGGPYYDKVAIQF